MRIILTSNEVQQILEEYMRANYAIGHQTIKVETPFTDLPATLTFEVVEKQDEQ